ncbi:hypothetical protein EUX98_g2764 [Antrodiella citrinella]|uniref:HIT domain-containing protein n=1 Tax=Antrodiella citrinella TaxID=2447956 RepID=A0A4S4MY72_9APHY|nr:hypothetical protein EUX98_g2764 [Antrodiella citrinella]
MYFEDLQMFQFERILNEDPLMHITTVLGRFPSQHGTDQSPAILRIERLPLPNSISQSLAENLDRFSLTEHTDIYSWGSGWLKSTSDRPDVKINIIHPATDVHIRKYSTQDYRMDPVVCLSSSSPPNLNRSRHRVHDILSGTSEAEAVLHRDPSPEFGYVILPDMKWDSTTISTLYLVAIVLTKDIRSLRDLKKRHLGMLRGIRTETTRIVNEKWGLEGGSLRFYIHYQPSYYHFHIHIVHVNNVGTYGSTVGQAHLLDDIISLLELDPDEGPSILERMTLTYALGTQHGLYKDMVAAQSTLS